MKKVGLILVVLLALAPLALSAQVVIRDNFQTLGDWQPAFGSWGIRGGMFTQSDVTTGLARADRMLRNVPQTGEIEISFNVRYQAGGFADAAALRAQQLHAGFGIQVGVDSSPPRLAWGAGNSYLLWLNLDTRTSTLRNNPEHFGFRGQVYRSRSNTAMAVMDGPYNTDILGALAEVGINLSIADLEAFLVEPVRIRIRVNYSTGLVLVEDPTAPGLWFEVPLDAQVLRGNYVSLRTNSLAVNFTDFTVSRR